MSTIKQIISRVDRKKPNGYNDETKLEWIASLDGKIAADVMLLDFSELKQFNYPFPDGLEQQPLVKYPHEDIYDLWLIAQIDAADQEWNDYQNAMDLYNAAYSNCVRWFISTYEPAHGCMEPGLQRGGTPTYYLTAYGLAVMQGFTGTVAEWLESLKVKGDKGDPGRLRIGEVVTLPVGEKATAEIVGDDDPVLNIGIPMGSDQYLPYDGGAMRGDIAMSGYAITGLMEPAASSDAATMGFAQSAGMVYRGLTSAVDTDSAALPQGAYRINTNINGITEGVLLQWQIIPGSIGIQLITSKAADLVWIRTCWLGSISKWRQLGFGYGEEADMPANAADGQLFLVKV